MITLDDIRAARMRIAPHIRRTPVIAASGLKDRLEPARVTLKLECLQVTGSFKARGAMNRVLATPRDALGRGLVTASGGNHGLAIARTAHVTGVPATIFLPANVSPAKLDKLLSARGEVVRPVDWAGWQQIEKAEVAAATKPAPRRKFVRIDDMLGVLDKARATT